MLEMILVSQSPQRREILLKAGFLFRVDTVEVSEIIDENINPERVSELISKSKVEAYVSSSKYLKTFNNLFVSADTIVVLGDKILGKPKDEAQAVEYLSNLSNKTHRVISGIYLFNTQTNVEYIGSESTIVQFKSLTQKEIIDYVKSGEPMDKAGAYAIQGEGKKFVQEYKGSYLNVVGFPLEHFERVLREKNWHVSRAQS